ncbi:general secretion pathway protein GspD [Massilia agilis]|uniref:General secretion pathway protein GspD n=1 Tax=Massilia agilis TaxID=1811226 RepID=A0ABT2DBB8_9BURK|nr:secretin N-terminal domain-containing protein [Massilia agilis]MCS0808514.1 general secretion pathway protein GspD [Massilia agilis]
MARNPVFRYFALLLAALVLAGCAAQRAYREGNDLIAHDQVEEALLKYREAVAADPTNAMYKLTYLHARDAATVRLLEQGDRDLAAGKLKEAQQSYQRVLAFAPANERARAGVRRVEGARRQDLGLAAAAEAMAKKDYDTARAKLDDILAERPDHPGALALMDKVKDATAVPPAEAGLAAVYRKPISLEFRDAPLRQVFEVIARHSGLNFVFDKDVRSDARTSIFLRDSTVEAAVYYLLMTNQLERQVMDRNTILIYPNNQAKVKEYQELAVKTFYLAYAEAKSVAASLKPILKSRDIVVDEKLNLVIVRDSPDAIKLAARMVTLLDVPEPEVMLDVEVMEVQRSRITELGVAWPNSLSLAPLSSRDGRVITLDELRALNGSTIGVAGVSATLNARNDDGDSNVLANPRIRVRNKEKANVVIGEKLPIITTTVSPGVGGFASESVTYADVGLTLNVEPTIHLDNEVAIKISLEVSNVIDSMSTKSGSTVYRIGKRSAATLLQLKDGENQVLAGLIRNEDRKSGRKLPLLGDVPLLGRLFGSTNDSSDKTEIVLSITPHLVRNIVRPPSDATIFAAGTDASFRNRPEVTASVPAAVPASRPVPAPVPRGPAGAAGAPQPAAVPEVPVSQMPAPNAADVK